MEQLSTEQIFMKWYSGVTKIVYTSPFAYSLDS